LGPFEEEEEGTGVASDVVKVKGEDLASPGPLKRNDIGTVTIPQYRYNKTKQHTQQILIILGNPPSSLPTKLHKVWTETTLNEILPYISFRALETLLYT